MHKVNLRTLFLIIPFLMFSCSEDESSGDGWEDCVNPVIDNINLSDQLGLEDDEVKMFTMPTPLQIATALRVIEVDYDESLLLENGEIPVCSDINSSLALGMYLTDLGYTTVYNNTQKSINYANDIQFIMEKLPIAYYVNDVFKKRFNDNIGNQDSLCKIILEGYNDANQYISETENEALGLLILTGAYVEGLYIASSSKVPHKWREKHDNLLIQQKLFLDNFIILLDGYTSNAQMAVVVDKLTTLKTAFDEIEISFNDKTDSYDIEGSITPTNRHNINELITGLRNDIITDIHQGIL